MEAKHLQRQYYAKALPLPSIVRQRRSPRTPCPPEPGPALQATPERLSLSPPPEIDPIPESENSASLWARVMATRIHVQMEERESNDKRSVISAGTGFVSQPDSDASAEPKELLSEQYNQATYGISSTPFCSRHLARSLKTRAAPCPHLTAVEFPISQLQTVAILQLKLGVYLVDI